MSTKHRLMIAVSVILLVAVPVIVSAVTKAQQPYTQVIMNLLNGQQYFGVPHVYQGDYNGASTNRWPVYYGPNNASSYWSLAGISSNQPVLELVGPSAWASGAMFRSETYTGGPVTITLPNLDEFLPLLAVELEDLGLRIGRVRVGYLGRRGDAERFTRLLDYLNVDSMVARPGANDVYDLAEILDEASMYGIRVIWEFGVGSVLRTPDEVFGLANNVAP